MAEDARPVAVNRTPAYPEYMGDNVDLRSPVRQDEEGEMPDAIDEGLEQLDTGRGIPIDEVQKELSEWLPFRHAPRGGPNLS